MALSATLAAALTAVATRWLAPWPAFLTGILLVTPLILWLARRMTHPWVRVLRAVGSRAAKREEPDAQLLPVERAYVIASDRYDRRHLTHALSATPEAHWITGAPSPADERQIALEARTVQAAMDARTPARMGRLRSMSTTAPAK